MRMWVSAAAVMPLVWAAAAQAQAMKGLLAADVAAVARGRTVDLRLYQQHGIDGPSPLIGGMLVQQGVARNAFVGVGLAQMYGRKRGGARSGNAPVASRKPAVSFVMKF
jgi:hypothetical protein